MGSRFVETLNADDITSPATYKSPFSILISVCENDAVCESYAFFHMMFNGSKSKLLFFKSRSSVMVSSEIMVNGEIVGMSKKNSSFRTYCIFDRS